MSYICFCGFSKGSDVVSNNGVQPIYALCPGYSMSIWKKLYIASALVGMVFLAVSLF